MKKTLFLRISTAILFSTLLVFSSVKAEMDGLQDFKGKPQAIENFKGKGKWLIVMMWASDCYICNKEAHEYVDFHLVHSDEDATVLGVSLDGESRKADAVKFIKKHHIDFPNLIGEPETISAMYKELTGQFFSGTPSFLIYNPKGELKAAQAGAVPTTLIEDFMQKNSIQKTSDK